MFRGVLDIEDAQAYTIKITRDAELEMDEKITQSLIDKVDGSLARRKKADPVRFVYDSEMPEDLLEILAKRFNLSKKISTGWFLLLKSYLLLRFQKIIFAMVCSTYAKIQAFVAVGKS